jgi:hypothetical protein
MYIFENCRKTGFPGMIQGRKDPTSFEITEKKVAAYFQSGSFYF